VFFFHLNVLSSLRWILFERKSRDVDSTGAFATLALIDNEAV
jgi:hypothetical protein